ncbi:MAG: SprB repeat-containing protein [Tenuifilaceae bacterium]
MLYNNSSEPTLTEGDLVNISPYSNGIQFPANSDLYDYQVEYRPNENEEWISITDVKQFTLPYSNLTVPTQAGRRIFFRSRIFLKYVTNPIQYSPYFENHFDVLKKIDVTLVSSDSCFCAEQTTKAFFNVGSIEQGDYIEIEAEGLGVGGEDKLLSTFRSNCFNCPVDIPVGKYNLKFSYYGVVEDGNSSLKLDTQKEVDIKLYDRTILISKTTKDVLCNNGSDGEIILTASNGFPNYTYQLGSYTKTSDDQVTFAGLSEGKYQLSVTDTKGCIGSLSDISIDQPNELTLGIPAINHITCYGYNDGGITIAASGGTGTYAYKLYKNGSYNQGNITGVFTGLGQGRYTVSVSNNCPAVVSNAIYVNEPVLLTMGLPSIKNVTCIDGIDGEIAIDAAGGTGSYTYTLTPGNVTIVDTKGVTFTGLPKGSYNVTMENANSSCNSVTLNPITINEPELLALDTPTVKNVFCNGGNNGSITIAASGGTNSYTYTLSRGGLIISICADGVFNGLIASKSYRVSVKNSNGTCTSVSTEDIEVSQPDALTLEAINPIDIKCYGIFDGKILVTAIGGTKPYTFTLYNYATVVESNSHGNFLGLGPSGGYSVNVKDATADCSEIVSGIKTIQQPPLFQLNEPVVGHISCFGQSTGFIQIAVTGGVLPYNYILKRGVNIVSSNDNGQFIGLPADDNYGIVATDAYSCRVLESAFISVKQPSAFIINDLIIKNVSCFGQNTGSITVTASGGKLNYSFILMRGATQIAQNTTGLFENLLAGNDYFVSVNDANSCGSIILGPKSITQPLAALALGTPVIDNVTCFKETTGKITITVSGGTPNYSYVLTRENNPVQTNTNGVFSSLIASDNYSVKVTDANGCWASTGDVKVTQPDEFNLAVINSKNVTCSGGIDGEVELSASGGTPLYSYSKDDNNWVAEKRFDGLIANPYTFWVKDSKGCKVSTTIHQVTQPSPIKSNATITKVRCKGESNGKLSFIVSGGTGIYNINLTGSNSYNQSFINVENTIVFGELKVGTYQYTITDSNGCIKTDSLKVLEPASALALSINSSTDPKCFGHADGEIQVDAKNGWGGYNYKLLTNAISNNIGFFDGLTKGIFDFEVEDAMGCKTIISASLNQPSPLTLLDPEITPLLCNGDAKGAIKISAKGGTPNYSFKLRGGGIQERNSTDSLFTNLPAEPNYNITVTDSHGCESSQNATVTQPAILDLIIYKSNHNNFNIKCFDGSDTVRVVPMGGTAPYTITFNGKTFNCPENGYTVHNLKEGNHEITVTDFHSCSFKTDFNLTQPNNFKISSIETIPALCNGTNTGKVKVSMQGGVFDYTLNLFDSQNNLKTLTNGPNYSFTGLNSGKFTINAVDKNGCEFTIHDTIKQPDSINIDFLIKNVSCFGYFDGSAEAKITGGTTPYTCRWIGESNNVISQTPMISEAKDLDYHFLFTDKNGCSSGSGKIGTLDTLVKISNPNKPLTIIASIEKVLCYAGNSGTIKLNGNNGWGAYKFSLNNSSFDPNPNYLGLSAGKYKAQIRDSQDCIVEDSLTIEENPLLTFSASKFDATCFGGQNGRIKVSASGGSLNYKYFINNKLFSGDIASLIAENYKIVVRDTNSCEAPIQTIEILSPTQINYSATVANSFCNESNGSITINPSGGISPYNVNWKIENTIFFVGNTLSDQSSGSYKFSVIDGKGCSREFQHSISDDGSPEIALISVKIHSAQMETMEVSV